MPAAGWLGLSRLFMTVTRGPVAGFAPASGASATGVPK
jgi:hypothetical protein